MTMDGNEDLVCAICFDAVTHSTVLPCTCKQAVYCTRCWDRSLAESLNSCGEARCPTCRAPINVDFDPEQRSLIFKCDEAQYTEDVSVRRKQAEDKLREQIRPAQVKLLQQYGAEHPHLHEASHAIEREGIPACTNNSSINCDEEELTQCWATHTKAETITALGQATPHCVCGSYLHRVPGRERARKCLELLVVQQSLMLPPTSGSPEFESLLDRIIESSEASVCYCDLCLQSIPVNCDVWTCENGETTILHANSYDVCNDCLTYIEHLPDNNLEAILHRSNNYRTSILNRSKIYQTSTTDLSNADRASILHLPSIYRTPIGIRSRRRCNIYRTSMLNLSKIYLTSIESLSNPYSIFI